VKVLILGVNGFIGHSLTRSILADTNWQVYGMDIGDDRIAEQLGHPRFHFLEGDIAINREWIEYHVKKCDVVLPLVAIATPRDYVQDPLRVFELDFEENLRIVRYALKYGTRVVFPSTSEIYGMCEDDAFNEETSNLVLGPISKHRWIYSCSKQLLDRVIWAYGQQQGLRFTLFRPFNWVGPNLDHIETAKEGSSRVVTQFLGHLMRGEPLRLVDGGAQRRCITDIRDGVDALMRILRNEGGRADGRILNIGNPRNDCSIAELANLMIDILAGFDRWRAIRKTAVIEKVSSEEYYGEGYQDIYTRVPDITNARECLGWEPHYSLREALTYTVEHYVGAASP
jgi:nucleoside-diphosphate-sugar epimerase